MDFRALFSELLNVNIIKVLNLTFLVQFFSLVLRCRLSDGSLGLALRCRLSDGSLGLALKTILKPLFCSLSFWCCVNRVKRQLLYSSIGKINVLYKKEPFFLVSNKFLGLHMCA